MKRFYAPLFSLALALTANAQVIFTSSLDSQEEFDRWTVINANDDQDYSGNPCTWKFSEANTAGSRTYYSYHSTNQADDWLISPAITATVAGDYLVTYGYEGGTSYAEAMKVFTGKAGDIETLKGNMVKDYPSITGVHTDYFLITLAEGESFYLGFQACSEPDKYRLYLRDVEVKFCQTPVDLTVTEITSPVSAEGLTSSEKMTIKIANQGLAAAPAGTYSVSVTVDGVEACNQVINKEIGVGEEISVELDQTFDFSVSHHTYAVVATVNHPDDVSASNNSLSGSIRHIGPAVEPYTMGFEASEDTSDLKFVNCNEDTGYWSIQVNGWFVSPSRTGQYCMCYNYSSVNAADDWAFLDGIQMEAGHHALKFWVSTMDDTHSEAFEVWYGNDATVDAMSTKIAEYTNFTTAPYIQKILIFELAEPQTVYIGFHATSPADQNWIAIDDIEVNSISATDVEIQVSNLTNPTEFLPTKANHDVKFNVMNQGIVDVKATINVEIDGASVYSKEENLVAQEDKTFTISGILDNVADGKHVIKVSAYNADEKNVDDNAIEMTFYKLGTADLAWDFEEGVIPEDLTTRSEDGNTLADGAIEEFGETGFATVKIQEHEYYGQYMLGVSTWFVEGSYSADRWIVLPQVHVNSADACFAFNAGSMSAYYNEKYYVEVSKETDYWWNYNKVLSVTSEDYNRKNRGVSLAEYVDQDIFIALHITTNNGDAIAFDNLALYGCSKTSDGVNSVSVDNNSGEVEYYNLQGVKVNNPTNGLYIVKQGNKASKQIIR